MQNLKILNNKEVKKILKELKEVYGSEEKLDYVFFKSSRDKIYVLSKKYGELNEENLRINNLGMYFAKIEKDGVRLSIDGAQMIKAKKNVLDVAEDELEKWLQGEDLEVGEKKLKGYVVVKFKKDVYGVGKYKEGRVINFVPKERRIAKLSTA